MAKFKVIQGLKLKRVEIRASNGESLAREERLEHLRADWEAARAECVAAGLIPSGEASQ